MNKNLFLGMFAAAGMLLATSCSNDELNVVQSGTEAQVSFKLGLEGDITTRAISDGTTANQLMYAVFDKDGNRISTIDKVVEDATFPTTANITLAKGQTYKVAFWAQNKACEAYTVSDDMNVTIDYAGNNNDETRDAFFKTVEFTVTGSTSIDVEMKRPFAQINVGVTKEDWDAAVASGIKIQSSSVVIKNAANYLNLVTGTVNGSIPVSYALNTIPEQFTTPEVLKVDTDDDGVKEEYKWLSMSYILPADLTTGYANTTLDNIAFEFEPENGNKIEFNNGLNAVPVRRNWRTNILGKILTGNIQFNITIDPVYDGDNKYPDGAAQELELAAKFGGEVTLTEDVVLEQPLEVVADMVLNLGKYKISNPNDYTIENSANLIINAEKTGGIYGFGGIRSKSGKITINGGTYTGASDWNTGTFQHILKAENTEVVINDGSFDAIIGGITNAMINVSKGSNVTINGGEFRNVAECDVIPQFAPYMFTYEENGKLIINGGNFYGGWRFNGTTATTDIYGGNFTVGFDGQSFHANSTHVLKVYGGTFTQKSISGNSLTSKLDEVVADGYKPVEYNGVFYVVANDVESVTPLTFSSMNIVSNTKYHLYGDFTNSNVSFVMASGVENVVFDGTYATNINELIITQNGQLIDNASTPIGERRGSVTIQNFDILSQINVFACKTEVVVKENNAEALMIYAGNCDIKVLNNTIDANFESHPTYRDANNTWNTNNYGIALNIFDYNLWLDGNTVTDAIGHAIGINGWEGTIDNGDENKIESFKNNVITVNSTTNTKRAAFKVWDDETYASNDDDTNVINSTAQAFIDAVLADGSNIFNITGGYEHTIFSFYNVNTNN